MILQTNLQGYIFCIQAIRDMSHIDRLLKITCPTLIIAGKKDMSCTVNQAIVLNRLIYQSRLIILKDAAHLSNVEQPDEFANSVISFVSEISSE
jgi:3-oxoadipate enol-lactonase